MSIAEEGFTRPPPGQPERLLWFIPAVLFAAALRALVALGTRAVLGTGPSSSALVHIAAFLVVPMVICLALLVCLPRRLERAGRARAALRSADTFEFGGALYFGWEAARFAELYAGPTVGVVVAIVLAVMLAGLLFEPYRARGYHTRG